MCFSFLFLVMFVFFFKQKTAYEMRISDWSSDVCSSDLVGNRIGAGDEIATLQLPVEYAVQPVGFLDVAIDRIGDRLGRVAVEMVVLPRHRAQLAHLPHPQLHSIALLARGVADKTAGLVCEIDENRNLFEHDDGRSEERRVGKECVRTGSIRGVSEYKKKK